jgi:hypothetical protein
MGANEFFKKGEKGRSLISFTYRISPHGPHARGSLLFSRQFASHGTPRFALTPQLPEEIAPTEKTTIDGLILSS